MSLWRAATLGALSLALGCSLDDRTVSVLAATGARGTTAGSGGAAEGGGGGDPGGNAGERSGPPGCATRVPAQALVTDFSDAVSITDDEGNPGLNFDVQGTVGGGQSFVYSAFGLPLPVASLAVTADNPALRVTASPGTPVSDSFMYLGFGLGWSAIARDCLDASGFRGVSFSIEGSIGTCVLRVGMQFSQNVQVGLNVAGTCELEGGCYPPQSALLEPSTGTLSVPFSDMHDGNPFEGVDATTLIGVNWQLFAPREGPPCEVDIVVDDVSFFE